MVNLLIQTNFKVVDLELVIEKEEIMRHMEIFYLPPGAYRRQKLVEWLKTQETLVGLPVNSKYQFIVKKDRDLKYLLKKGIVKQIRIQSGFRKCACHQSYLVLNDNKA